MTQPPFAGLRILSVENDALNAEAMKCLLEMQGALVLGPVGQVQEALTLIDRDRPDLALVDFRLNGETIEPVIDALKARIIPFVLVTACAPCLMPSEYSGMPTVVKPFMVEDLYRAVSEVRVVNSPAASSQRQGVADLVAELRSQHA